MGSGSRSFPQPPAHGPALCATSERRTELQRAGILPDWGGPATPASSLGLRFLATPACLAAHGGELVPRKKPELPPSVTHSEVPPGARSVRRPSPTRSAQPFPMEAALCPRPRSHCWCSPPTFCLNAHLVPVQSDNH